jgi:hypothetical protein
MNYWIALTIVIAAMLATKSLADDYKGKTQGHAEVYIASVADMDQCRREPDKCEVVIFKMVNGQPVEVDAKALAEIMPAAGSNINDNLNNKGN